MAFQPAVLNPEPEPWFVKELDLIDPDLRVVWGFPRYLMHNWVIEVKLSPAVYAKRYFSFLASGDPRFIQRPIYDHSQPIYNDEGESLGFQIVGYQEYDLAPEWEWRKTIQTSTGGFKPLGMDDILGLKKEYAWNRNHAYSRAKFEEEERAKDEQKEKDEGLEAREIGLQALDQAWLETGKRVTARPLTALFTE